MKRYIFTLTVILFQEISLLSQSPYLILERAISVHFTNTPTKEALTVVSRTGRFEFSYNARILDLDKKLTLFTNSMTVRETLYQMLGDTYTYQQQGEYLIIKKNPKPKKLLTGYILDSKTGKKVKNATVYDAQTLRSTTTDENGFYSLKVSERSTVVVAQLKYEPKILQITEESPRFLKLDLDIKQETIPIKKRFDYAQMPTKLANFFISPLNELSDLNVQDSIHRRFQLSFLPYIGTNFKMSGKVVNDISINALVGYSRGNRFMELAGVGNLTKESVSGLQVGGIFNVVKGDVKGLQIAGVFNHENDTLRGAQWGGVWNFAGASQAFNQTAGVANIALKGSLATQIAGVSNIADSIKAIQISGVVNQAKNVKGLQISGVVNNTKNMKGVQISGVFNRAKSIKGIQIGVINYADSLNGLQIGLINIAKNGGLNTIELGSNELNTYNMAYKSGTKSFYTAFMAGITPQSDGNIWTYGFGIGTMLRLNKWSDMNIEADYRHVNVGSYSDFKQEWIRLGFYWNIHLNRRFELAFGPSVNGLVTDNSVAISTENRGKIFPSYIKRKVYTANNSVWDTWLGGSLGLRVNLFQ